MVVHMIMITNKSGSLIYSRTFNDQGLNVKLLQSNWAVTTSSILVTFVVGMSQQVAPVPDDPLMCSGVQLIEGHDHNLHFCATASGNAFVFITDPATTTVRELFAECYGAFVDTVLRHPSYALDSSGAGQHIHSAKYDVFTARLDAAAVKKFAT